MFGLTNHTVVYEPFIKGQLGQTHVTFTALYGTNRASVPEECEGDEIFVVYQVVARLLSECGLRQPYTLHPTPSTLHRNI